MSDESEKPFDATPHRLEKAKREGNVARSAEIGANLAFAAAALAATAVVPLAAGLARRALTRASAGGGAQADVIAIVAFAFIPIAAAALAGTAGAVLQNGGLPFIAPAVKFERLNPVQGLKRTISRETLSHGLRALLAFSIAASVMLPSIRAAAVEMTIHAPITAVSAAAWQAVQHVAGIAFAVGMVFAVTEYAAARREWLRKLRMSFEDRKREIKEQEGDPLERGRRRTLHRSLLRGTVADVKKASFVVVNPTHVSVALLYRPPKVAVPTVLVRAAGDVALEVRRLAEQQRIPIVQDVGLARALYRDGRVGNPIDRVHFIAVAEVVAALARAGVLNA